MNYEEQYDNKYTPKKFLLELNKFLSSVNIPDNGIVKIGGWDGGGDSGYVDINSEFPNNEVVSEYMNDQLGYGSWAGEFTSVGDVYYDVNEKQIILEGNEYETDYDEEEVEIDIESVTIPDDITELNIEYENGSFNIYYLKKLEDGRTSYYNSVNEICPELVKLIEDKLDPYFEDVEDYLTSCFELTVDRENNKIIGDVSIALENEKSVNCTVPINELIEQII